MNADEKDVPRNNPPRNGLILFYAVIAVALLASLKPAFDAYYDAVLTGARADRLSTYSDLEPLNAAEAQWNERRMPIDRAMSELGTRGRGAFPQINPEPGEAMNLGPLNGWTQSPLPLPPQVEEATAAAAAAAEAAAEAAAAMPVEVPAGALADGIDPADVPTDLVPAPEGNE